MAVYGRGILCSRSVHTRLMAYLRHAIQSERPLCAKSCPPRQVTGQKRSRHLDRRRRDRQRAWPVVGLLHRRVSLADAGGVHREIKENLITGSEHLYVEKISPSIHRGGHEKEIAL